MVIHTSDKFVSVSASGSDWRDVTRAVLKQLETGNIDVSTYALGFLYITDYLAEDAVSILTLLRDVTQIENWCGTTSAGVLSTSSVYVDESAMTILLARMDSDDFKIIPSTEEGLPAVSKGLEPWLEQTEPMLCLIHGDPLADTDVQKYIADFSRFIGGFTVGGLSSSRTEALQFSGNTVTRAPLSGVVFSQDVVVATALTQGCAPVGGIRTVTRCEDHVVMELDGQRALDAFLTDVEEGGGANEDLRTRLEKISRDDVHVALMVSGSDQQDYTVRNIIGIDPDKGWVALGHNMKNGDHIMFVRRDDQTVAADLSRMLVDIRRRVMQQTGAFAPAGGIYISCVARANMEFGPSQQSEMDLVHEVLGDVPMAGFYANGEISTGRLYGYAGILILFL